jgi:hypothetical protein
MSEGMKEMKSAARLASVSVCMLDGIEVVHWDCLKEVTLESCWDYQLAAAMEHT